MSRRESRSGPPEDPSITEIEREVIAGREFSLFEAIGRSAGGLLKGTSPVTRKRQAEVEVQSLLEHHLRDTEGALAIVLLLEISGSEELLASYDDASGALRHFVERLLSSEARLCRFVTSVDAQWGRIYCERPHFDRPGCPPDSDDPYTRDAVSGKLTALLESLQGGKERCPD